MKLSSLTPQDKIKLAAELDGKRHIAFNKDNEGFHVKGVDSFPTPLPPYTTSYDTIIPLIQKQSQTVQNKIGTIMCDMPAFKYKWFWQATPSQLLDALLVATGRAEL